MRYLFLILAILLSCTTFSQSKKIKDLEERRKITLLEIENTDKLLKQTRRTTETILTRIKLITSQIQSRQNVVLLLEQEINQLDTEQKRIQGEVVELEAELAEKQKGYAKAIDGMLVKRHQGNKLLYILSGKSLSESFRRFMYLKDYSEWRSKQAEEIKVQRDQLQAKRTELEQSRKDKQALLASRESEQRTLKNEEEQKKTEVAEANKKQSELQKVLSEKRKQANTLNKQIEKLIAEEVARQEREAKRLAEEARKKEQAAEAARRPKANISKPKDKTLEQAAPPKPATETKENFALSNNFASNKGRLPMPVTGSARIISGFGVHQHDAHITTNSNGVDIQSAAGSDARAVFNGEVSRVIAFPGYNNCIIIRHGGYYTFYGNIQNVYVKQGQQVATGQTLGKIYTDSELGFAQMHFQLWKGTSKMDPAPWLKK